MAPDSFPSIAPLGTCGNKTRAVLEAAAPWPGEWRHDQFLGLPLSLLLLLVSGLESQGLVGSRLCARLSVLSPQGLGQYAWAWGPELLSWLINAGTQKAPSVPSTL